MELFFVAADLPRMQRTRKKYWVDAKQG